MTIWSISVELNTGQEARGSFLPQGPKAQTMPTKHSAEIYCEDPAGIKYFPRVKGSNLHSL